MRARGLGPRRVRMPLAYSGHPLLPSARRDGVGTREHKVFEAQYPARTFPGSTSSPQAVNASSTSLRTATHDSGATWRAMPSSYETFIHCTSPALPAHRVPFESLGSRSSSVVNRDNVAAYKRNELFGIVAGKRNDMNGELS